MLWKIKKCAWYILDGSLFGVEVGDVLSGWGAAAAAAPGEEDTLYIKI